MQIGFGCTIVVTGECILFGDTTAGAAKEVAGDDTTAAGEVGAVELASCMVDIASRDFLAALMAAAAVRANAAAAEAAWTVDKIADT